MTTRNNISSWRVLPEPPVAHALAAALGEDPLVTRVLAQRGITTVDQARAFLDPSAYIAAPPEALPDLAAAVDRLGQAITDHARILIWGDFDVDGQTATALLLDGLRRLGADVAFYIPNRLRESHGIRVEHLAAAIDRHHPRLLLTCDTGISAHDAIAYARERGLEVVVTDHHDLPPALPDAHALVNPKRLAPDHPLHSLPGVGVAYKLVEALHERLDGAGEVADLLDLVALGIVADVAEQSHDTRYLLQLGLQQLRVTRRIGLRMLLETAGLQPEHLTAEDIGFQLGPRLNAAGRLDDAAPAVELLTTEDPVAARVIATNLDGLNRKRRVMQSQILAAAQAMLADHPEWLDFTALVLGHPAWHPGLIGIVAGQLAEQYRRPCVLLVLPEGEPLARGSARSVPGYDIGGALTSLADMLTEFGGHPGAAGLSLPQEENNRFRRRLSQVLDDQYTPTEVPPLEVAAEIPLAEITPALVDQIDRLAPFGLGNPPVVLAASGLTVATHRLLGRERLHRRLTVEAEGGARQRVLWWNGAEHPLPDGPFDLAFTAGWNVYQGQRELVLTLVDLRLPAPAADIAVPQRRQIEDWRRLAPDEALARFAQAEPSGLIWAELPNGDVPAACRRADLVPAQALLVYTMPPASSVLFEALEAVQPQRVYLAGYDPIEQDVASFQRRLLGMGKYTVSHLQGRADLTRLAGATAQTPGAVVWGLRLLAATGQIGLAEEGGENGGTVRVMPPESGMPTPDMSEDEARAALLVALNEARAYRLFAHRAALDSLLGA